MAIICRTQSKRVILGNFWRCIMSRKVVILISFVLMLVLAGNAPAATLVWDNGGNGNLWSIAENWDPDGVPTSSDTAQIFLADANCVIDATVNAQCLMGQVGGG